MINDRKMNGEKKKLTSDAVYAVVKSIPLGKVMTYGNVARIAGFYGAARAVGRLLHANTTPIVVPCHRVVFADGSLSSTFCFGGANVQREWLEKEGVTFIGDKVDMRTHSIM